LANDPTIGVRQNRGVDDRRVALQKHPSFQAILIDTGHDRALLGLGCFALDERGQSHRGKQELEARGDSGSGAILIERFDGLMEFAHHHAR